MPPIKKPQWEETLKKLSLAKIKKEKADGTTAMGLDCFLNGILYDIGRDLSFPRGTNALYFIKEELRKILINEKFLC